MHNTKHRAHRWQDRSAARTRRRIDDILSQRRHCLHEKTITHIAPVVLDDRGDYSGGVRIKRCASRPCSQILEVRR